MFPILTWRPAAEQRKRPPEQASEPEEESEDDEEIWERENDLTQMRKAVCQEFNLFHPYEYEGDNLCDLYKRNKFQAKYKIKDLQDIC